MFKKEMRTPFIFLFLWCCLVIFLKDEVSAETRKFAENNTDKKSKQENKTETKHAEHLNGNDEGDTRESLAGSKRRTLKEEAKEARAAAAAAAAAAKKPGKIPKYDNYKRTPDEDMEFPTGVFDTLNKKFDEIGSMAIGAKRGLRELRDKWASKGNFGDRSVYAQALHSAAKNIERFANAGDNPGEGILAAVDIVTQLESLTDSIGKIASTGLSFTSGFLSLFGIETEKTKSFREIVAEKIDKAFENGEPALINAKKAAIDAFDTSKAYVDSFSRCGSVLSVDQANNLNDAVPLLRSLEIEDTLSSRISELKDENEEGIAKKALTFIELYTTLSVLKNMILLQTAALIPDELASSRNKILAKQEQLRSNQIRLIRFLYKGNVEDNIMPFYDPEQYPVTDAYAIITLKLPNYSREFAGTWCIMFLRQKLVWTEHLPMSSFSYPVAARFSPGYPEYKKSGYECTWKIVPHPNSLITIQNVFRCPKHKHCNKYLVRGKTDLGELTLKTGAELWGVKKGSLKSRLYMLRSKHGCGSENKGEKKWCDSILHRQVGKNYITLAKQSVRLRYLWMIKKEPKP